MSQNGTNSTPPAPERRIITREDVIAVLRSRYALAALIILLLIVALVGIGASTMVSSRIVRLGLSDIGMLETQAAYFTNVQTISKARDVWGWKVPFTSSKYIFSYDGVVRAGVNFELIGVKPDPLTQTIHVTLPEAEIIDISIDQDSLELYDESKNIFSPLKVADLNNALIEMEEEAREQAIGNGILDAARANAVTLVTNFLAASYDMNIYTVVFE